MDYRFFIHPRARKELESVSSDTKERIAKKLKEMITNEWRDLTDYDVKKLQGTRNDLYRTRIGGWRIMFMTKTTDSGETVEAGIVGADQREGAYGNVERLDQRADEFSP